jgi:hypothetical protein
MNLSCVLIVSTSMLKKGMGRRQRVSALMQWMSQTLKQKLMMKGPIITLR